MLRVPGACLAALLLLAAPAPAARDFVDDAGRRVSLPDRVERVHAAGPPASALVFAVAPDKLLGWKRAFRPNRLLGLLWLAEILYPDHFRHDYRQEIAEFHERFYHQRPAAAQIDRLLSEPGVSPR